MEGAARCPSCSQNAHGETVLAWDKSASRRARGWAGEKVVRSKGQPRPLPLRELVTKITLAVLLRRTIHNHLCCSRTSRPLPARPTSNVTVCATSAVSLCKNQSAPVNCFYSIVTHACEVAESCRTQRQYLESIGFPGDASFAAITKAAY